MPDTLLGTGQALDNSTNTIISEFRLLQDEKTVMRQVSSTVPLKPGMGPTVYINNYGRVQAVAVADGADVANAQQLSDAQTTGTPGQVAVQVVIAGSAIRRGADRSLLANTAKIMDRALKLKIERDGTGQLSAFPTMGAAATVISPGLVAAAVAQAEIGNSSTDPEPMDDLNIVLHPWAMLVLGGRIVPYTDTLASTGVFYGVADGAHVGTGVNHGAGSGAPGSRSDVIIRKGPRAIAHIQGWPIWLTANIAVDSSNDGSGAVIDRIGLNYCDEVSPTMVHDEDPSKLGAKEFTEWAAYTWFTYRPTVTGNELLTDCSRPTS